MGLGSLSMAWARGGRLKRAAAHFVNESQRRNGGRRGTHSISAHAGSGCVCVCVAVRTDGGVPVHAVEEDRLKKKSGVRI